MKIKKGFIVNILEYILASLLIIGNLSMIERDQAINISEGVLSLFLCFVCASLIVLDVLGGKKKGIKKKNTYRMIVTIIIGFGVVFTRDSNITAGLIRWIIPSFFIGLYFITTRDKTRVWLKLTDVVTVLATVSLFLYLFGSVLHIIKPTNVASYLYDSQYKYCNTYYRLLYEAQRIQGIGLFDAIYRNCGIFIEAPMYNLVLCLGLLSELSFRDKPRKPIIVILALTILTTYTTTGILCLIFIVVIRFFQRENRSLITLFKMLVLPLLLLLTIFTILSVFENKMSSISGANSYSVRLDHLMAFLKMFIDRPLLGHGYGNIDAFYNYTAYRQGYSVGLPALLGRSGILLFLCYLIPFCRCSISAFIEKEKSNEKYFWIGCFLLFFLTASVYKTIFIFLLYTQLFWNSKIHRRVKK